MVEKERFVLDASVAAKWFLDDEEFIDLARSFLERFLKGEIEFFAPTIIKYEVGHLLTKAYREKRKSLLSQEECIRAY